MKKVITYIVLLGVLFILLFAFSHIEFYKRALSLITPNSEEISILKTLNCKKPSELSLSGPSKYFFAYNFMGSGILYEAGDVNESINPFWWLDSGAIMYASKGTGRTIQGNLHEDETWRRIYELSNPLDTDNGAHPQNIFRLLSRTFWKNFIEEVYFKVDGNQLSSSLNRNESNGVLLFSRYKNENTLYYAGLRVDGTAVIKKKLGGLYYTLRSEKIFPGAYNRFINPNLLPKNTWIGLRIETQNLSSGSVRIRLFGDIGKEEQWGLLVEAFDDGITYGPLIDERARVGIRSDFMDVSFRDYKIREL